MPEADRDPTLFSTTLLLLDERFVGLGAVLDHAVREELRARNEAWFDAAPEVDAYACDFSELTYRLAELIGRLPARSAVAMQVKARAALWLLSRDEPHQAETGLPRPEARVLANLIHDIGAL